MAVSVRLDPSVDFGNPEVALEESYYAPEAFGRTYDVSPDGERFLMIKEAEETGADTINLVLNWFEELKHLAPSE